MTQTLTATPGRTAALAAYADVSVAARAATASPQQLVTMLYDRLAQLLRAARSAAASGRTVERLRATERALAIVDGLDATLDDARGGSVAQSLHQLYALLRDRLLAGRTEALEEALVSVEAVAAAWRAIATPAAKARPV